jgi:hypothetical protein
VLLLFLILAAWWEI